MTNCCNPMTGKCEQGHGCPARETPHDTAARHFCDASPPGYYELIDAPGNWIDRTGLVGRFFAVAGLIAVCAFVGVVVLV